MFFFLQKIYKISFNSRPHAEVDGPVGLKRTYITSFNSRPHAEVDFFCLSADSFPSIFQLTTSRRGRPWSWMPGGSGTFFQLTTSRRGRHNRRRKDGRRNSFNSRPHAEVDKPLTGSSFSLRSFNSRPHAEVDDRQIESVLAMSTFNSRPHAEVDNAPNKTA